MIGAVRLACPECGGALTEDGAIRCDACGRAYAERGGVLRLLPSDIEVDDLRTAEAFAWHGRQFAELEPEHERHFLDVIAPLDPDFFAGKVVLDAGCGPGRHAVLAARWGAREVWAIDLGEAVETAASLAAGQPRVRVAQADLLRPPFPPGGPDGGFDFVFSIGVVHHLPDPGSAVRSLARLLRPGGELFVWVYAHEGNGLVRRLVEPVRRVTTRMRPSWLRVVALPFAAVVYALARGVYGPLRGTGVGRRLPARGHLGPLTDMSFRRIRAIASDQLVAPQTRYVRREELRAWLEAAGLVDIETTKRNGNSWRGRGRRP